MIAKAERLEEVWPLWEEEVLAYQALGQVVQQEWDFLIQGNMEALASSLSEKESHLLKILNLHRKVEQIFAEMVQDLPEPGRPHSIYELTRSLPQEQAQKINHYRGLLSTLRQEVHQANERNKRLIQESLNFIHDLFSLLTHPSSKEETLYSPAGKMPPPASWVSRKV